jgi:hypothetical protein
MVCTLTGEPPGSHWMTVFNRMLWIVYTEEGKKSNRLNTGRGKVKGKWRKAMTLGG